MRVLRLHLTQLAQALTRSPFHVIPPGPSPGKTGLKDQGLCQLVLEGNILVEVDVISRARSFALNAHGFRIAADAVTRPAWVR